MVLSEFMVFSRDFGPLVRLAVTKMLITFEPHRILLSNFVNVCMLTLSKHWHSCTLLMYDIDYIIAVVNISATWQLLWGNR